MPNPILKKQKYGMKYYELMPHIFTEFITEEKMKLLKPSETAGEKGFKSTKRLI